MGSLQFGELLRAALSVVEQDVGKLVNRHTVSLMKNILRIAGSAGSVTIAGLAKRIG